MMPDSEDLLNALAQNLTNLIVSTIRAAGGGPEDALTVAATITSGVILCTTLADGKSDDDVIEAVTLNLRDNLEEARLRIAADRANG
jgi:hypothetical protein